jgi:hypothetical protein
MPLSRILHAEGSQANGGGTSALQTYGQVAALVQQGQLVRARELALTIPIDHLRVRALLLANCSRRL